MTRTVREYLRAWERVGASSPRLNSRLVPGACVLETLSMVATPDQRYVFVDDFGYAVSYCRRRLWEDLLPPYERGSDEPVERWHRLRSAFSLDELADAWTAADAALSALLRAFIADGYSYALGDRLREIVNTYALDLELGEVYVLPQDLQALLAQAGYLTVVRQQEVAKAPATKRQAFNFTDSRRRAALARWLQQANQPALRSVGVEVAPEEVDALAQGGVLERLQIGVARPEPLGLHARLGNKARVGHVRHLQLRKTALTDAEEVSRPAQA
jgi:hypothetical protein